MILGIIVENSVAKICDYDIGRYQNQDITEKTILLKKTLEELSQLGATTTMLASFPDNIFITTKLEKFGKVTTCLVKQEHYIPDGEYVVELGVVLANGYQWEIKKVNDNNLAIFKLETGDLRNNSRSRFMDFAGNLIETNLQVCQNLEKLLEIHFCYDPPYKRL